MRGGTGSRWTLDPAHLEDPSFEAQVQYLQLIKPAKEVVEFLVEELARPWGPLRQTTEECVEAALQREGYAERPNEDALRAEVARAKAALQNPFAKENPLSLIHI